MTWRESVADSVQPEASAGCSAARSRRLRLIDGLDAIKNLAEIALCDLNVIVVLQIEPKLCGCAERLGEPKRRIGADASLFAGDPLDPSARQAAGLGKSARRHLQRNQELLPQNLAGMHRLEVLGHLPVPLLPHDPIKLNRIMIPSLSLGPNPHSRIPVSEFAE